MQPIETTSSSKLLLEKYTKSGSLTYDYDACSLRLSNNLFILLELERDGLDATAEWELPCFSEHTQRLLKTRIALGEVNMEPIELRVVFHNRQGEQRSLRYCCEFVGRNSASNSHTALDIKSSPLQRIALFQDITDSVQLAEKSNYYQDRIQLALENTQTGTWDYDVSKNLLFWDSAMYSLFEGVQNKRHIKFQDWIDFISVEYRDEFIEQFNASISNQVDIQSLAIRVRTLTPFGDDKFIDIKGRCFIDDSNRIVRIVGTCNDVTASERTQQKLLELAELAQKNEMLLHEAGSARRRFIANVSHEVRTPMNGVLGALQILQSYDFNDELKGIIDMANTSSHELLNILNNVLDLAKLDANKLEVRQVEINVKAVLDSLVYKYEKELDKEVRMYISMPESSARARLGDPLKFNQIIDNLLSNAVKFTHQGEINVNIEGDNSHFCLSVRDTGIGIQKSALGAIFDPFRQQDESNTREYNGTGLGLAVAKQLSEYMGGSITVDSDIGKGSTFKLVLPLPELVENIENQSISSLNQIVPDLDNVQILIATDDLALYKTLAHLLQPTRARLTRTIDGNSLVQQYRINKHFGLIIIDAALPLCDIVNICGKLHSEGSSPAKGSLPAKGSSPAKGSLPAEGSQLHIMLITEQVEINVQKAYFNAGISHIISKPMKFDAFYDALIQYKNK